MNIFIPAFYTNAQVIYCYNNCYIFAIFLLFNTSTVVTLTPNLKQVFIKWILLASEICSDEPHSKMNTLTCEVC